MGAAHQRQWLRPDHIIHTQFAIKMREQDTGTGRFPLQRLQPFGLHRQQHQTLDAREIFRGGFGHSLCCGKMDIAVGDINGCPIGFGRALQVVPFIGAQNLVDQHGAVMALA